MFMKKMCPQSKTLWMKALHVLAFQVRRTSIISELDVPDCVFFVHVRSEEAMGDT